MYFISYSLSTGLKKKKTNPALFPVANLFCGFRKISFLNIKAYCQLNFKNDNIYSFFSGKILASIKNKVFHNSVI